MRAAAEYFDSNGFIRTDPPILTPAACEGTSTLFPVDYFGDPAFLTQSGQLYIESTALGGLGKVYSFGPTFRAEKSKTRRHLTEFWMIEPEVAYCDLDCLLVLAENFLSHIVQSVLKNRGPELAPSHRARQGRSSKRSLPPFPRLRYDEAAAMLNQAHKDGHLEAPFEYGNDFGSPDETWLSSQFDKPVMVNRYPADVKAFYMEPDPAGPALRTLCPTMLAPEGYGEEIIGGSQRGFELTNCSTAASSTALQPARGSLPVVPRSAPLRIRSACRFWYGDRARRCLDLRPGPRARDDPLRANPAAPYLSLRSAQTHRACPHREDRPDCC